MPSDRQQAEVRNGGWSAAWRRAAGVLFVLSVLAGSGPAGAAEPPAAAAPATAPQQTKTVTIFQGREVTLKAPAGWSLVDSVDPELGVTTVRVAASQGGVELLLTFIPDPEGRLRSRAALEAELRQGIGPYLEAALEKEIVPHTFEAAGGSGIYTVLTDKRFVSQTPPAGEWRYATNGLRAWNGVSVLFTLLSNALDNEPYGQALELIRSGTQESRGPQPGAPAPKPMPEPATASPGAPPFTLPTAPWRLLLPQLPGVNLEIREHQAKPGGSGAYFLLADEKSGLVASFWIEPIGECRTSQACRDFVWKGLQPKLEPLQPKDISLAEVDGVSYASYLVPVPDGKGSHQRNWIVELVRDDFWIDLHLSQTPANPQTLELLGQIVRGITFAPKKPEAP